MTTQPQPGPGTMGPSRIAWLVARRELRTRLTGVPFVVGTVALVLVLAGYLLVQGLAVQRDAPTRVGLSGQAIVLAGALQQSTEQLGLPVTTFEVTDPALGADEVRDGSLDVLVSGAPGALQVTVRDRLDGRLHGTLTSLMQQQALDAQLAEAGLKPGDVQAAIAKMTPQITMLAPADPNYGQRLAIAIVAVVLLYYGLVFFGCLLARELAEEKEDGVLELVLSTVRADAWLGGKAAGIGLIGLAQLVIAAVVGLAVAAAAGVLTLPGTGLAALGSAALGYLLGYLLYAGALVACGASAAQRRDLRRVLMPVLAALGLAFAVGAAVLAGAPESGAAAALSVLPPFAPVLLTGRLVLGVAPLWQVLIALALTLATAYALARFGRRVFARTAIRP
jgi:ABC-2 type transport system permease protein